MDRLLKHLSGFISDGLVDIWHDRRIAVGSKWRQEIELALDAAGVALILVSSEYLKSEFISTYELPRILSMAQQDGMEVIPIILRGCDFGTSALAVYQAANRMDRPVSAMNTYEEEELWLHIAGTIASRVEISVSKVAAQRVPADSLPLREWQETGQGRSPRLPSIWNVPYLRNPHFTGREALVDQLHRKLTDGRVALTAVRGMGGVGKTQLAVEYVYRHAGDSDLVWWLRAAEPATLLEDYAALADPLGVGKVGEGDLAALADAVRQALTRRDRWLLVFDNATAPDDVNSLLPKAGAGRVLITSRNPSWPFAAPLDVPVLDRNAAIEFLLKQTSQHDRHTADALATELGDLPLALAQAAAHVRATGVGLAGYVDLFRSRRQELWTEERPPADYPATVGTTMAIDRLRASKPLALDLLSLCAFLAPEPIPRLLLIENHEALPSELGATVADPLRLNRLVSALRRYSLVEVTGEGLSFHPLIQGAARDHLTGAERRRWIEAAVALMHAGFPYDRDDPNTWAASGGLLAHALAAAGYAEETARDLEEARWLLNQTAKYLETRAEFAPARAGFARALELAEAVLGPDHPEVATYVNNLGSVLQDLGDLAGARAAYERALRVDEKSFGGAHPNVAIRVNSLGLALQALGDLPGARAAFERALKIDEASFGPEHPKAAIRINSLGLVLRAQGDLAGARAAFERALTIDEAVYGPDHPEVAIRVNNLGLVLQDQGDPAGARAAFERALAIDERSFGPDHPRVANDINNLSGVLHDQGDLAGARAAYERALGIFEKFLPADHPNVATARENLRVVVEQEQSTSRP